MLGVIIMVLFVGSVVSILVATGLALFDAEAGTAIGWLIVGVPSFIISIVLFATVYRVDIQYTDTQGNTHSYKKVTQVDTDRGNLTFRDKDDVVHNVKFSTYKTTD